MISGCDVILTRPHSKACSGRRKAAKSLRRSGHSPRTGRSWEKSSTALGTDEVATHELIGELCLAEVLQPQYIEYGTKIHIVSKYLVFSQTFNHARKNLMLGCSSKDDIDPHSSNYVGGRSLNGFERERPSLFNTG